MPPMPPAPVDPPLPVDSALTELPHPGTSTTKALAAMAVMAAMATDVDVGFFMSARSHHIDEMAHDVNFLCAGSARKSHTCVLSRLPGPGSLTVTMGVLVSHTVLLQPSDAASDAQL